MNFIKAAAPLLYFILCWHTQAKTQPQTADKLSFGVGSSGIGVGYTKMIKPWLGIDAGLSYMDLAFNFKTTLAYQDLIADPHIQFLQASALADFMPFTKVKNGETRRIPLRLQAGFSYRTNATYTAKTAINESITLGQFQLTSDEIGYVDVEISTNKLLPYLGAGYDLALGKQSLWGIGFYAGTWYHGKPEVEMYGKGMLQDNAENAEQFEENISSYRWYPNMSIRLNYTLVKK